MTIHKPRPLDAVLPVALVLWAVGVHSAHASAVDDYGLLRALPVVFYVSVAALVCSIVVTLLAPRLSPLRLGLHLVALVVVLHATMPLIFHEPIYSWVYKHVGVVGYINLHGRLNSGIDIYHNWPGFFAVAAWFTRIAGAASPLNYAAWAPVYFNLLTCLELGFVFRYLPVTPRARWLGLFLFVAGNWVGQDYFAPQALAFVLSVAVVGMALAWLQTDRPVRVVRFAQGVASRFARAESGPPEFIADESPRAARFPAVAALILVFAAIVITHQLSPYVVLFGLGLLTMGGLVRPRWVIVVLGVMAVAFLLLHLSYVEKSQDLFGSLGNPFRNLHGARPDGSVVMTGRRLTALAAPLLILCLWMLAFIGVTRRVRGGRPTAVLVLLAFSPLLIALVQSYGGEAVFRIYLFSLPWIALLGATALDFRPPRRLLWPALGIGTVLLGAVGLFLGTVFGAAELYTVRSGEVQASQYFYDHAAPGGVLTLIAPNFPTRVGDRYDKFTTAGDNPVDLLTTVPKLRHRVLSAANLPRVERFVADQSGGGAGSHYLVLSTGQQVFAEVLGLLPPGSLASLDVVIGHSADWKLFYRNPDAVIYRFAPRSEQVGPEAPPPPPPVVAHRSTEHTPDLAGVAVGVAGLAALVLVLRRRANQAITDGGVVPVSTSRRVPARRILVGVTVAGLLGLGSAVVLANDNSVDTPSTQASPTKETTMTTMPINPTAPAVRSETAQATSIVHAGDSYWSIAERVMRERLAAPTTADVAMYWTQLMALNHATRGSAQAMRLYAGQMVAISDTVGVPDATPTTTSPPPAASDAVAPAGSPTVTVHAGDNFWRIAKGTVSARGAPPTGAVVRAYWVDLVEANHDRLAHGDDPNLIYAGQVFVLP